MMLMRFTIVSAALAALVCLALRGFAQTNAAPSRQSSATRSRAESASPSGDPDQTLEIAPRVAPPAVASPSEPATESPPAADNAEGESGRGSAPAAPARSTPAPGKRNPGANPERPYLGASLQYHYAG